MALMLYGTGKWHGQAACTVQHGYAGQGDDPCAGG